MTKEEFEKVREGDFVIRTSSPTEVLGNAEYVQYGQLVAIYKKRSDSIRYYNGITEKSLLAKNIRLATYQEVSSQYKELFTTQFKKIRFPHTGAIYIKGLDEKFVKALVNYLDSSRKPGETFTKDTIYKAKYIAWNMYNFWGVMGESSKNKYSKHYLLTGKSYKDPLYEKLNNLNQINTNNHGESKEQNSDLLRNENARSSGEGEGRYFSRRRSKLIATTERLIGHEARVEKKPKRISHFEIRSNTGLYSNLKRGVGSGEFGGRTSLLTETSEGDVSSVLKNGFF